jgi:hypothetical protein
MSSAAGDRTATRAILVAGALATAILSGACSGEGGGAERGRIDFYVDKGDCDTSCPDARYHIFLLRRGPAGRCVFAWSSATGTGDHLLPALDLELDEELSVWLLFHCGTEVCPRCTARQEETVKAQTVSKVRLVQNPGCTVEMELLPCESCVPNSLTYCDGNDRISCDEQGRSAREACPHGCQVGACTKCAAVTFYRDADSDGYGDPTQIKSACSRPNGYVHNKDDCNDEDGDVHPKQTQFFARHTKGAPNDPRSYDFNCDGVEEQQFTTKTKCEVGTCKDGWSATIPGCGQSAEYVSCAFYALPVPHCRDKERGSKNQACR